MLQPEELNKNSDEYPTQIYIYSDESKDYLYEFSQQNPESRMTFGIHVTYR